MAPTGTAWGARIAEVLDDGEWHHIDDVATIAASVVPPGVAYRFQERLRRKSRSGATGPDRRRLGDHKTAVEIGKRAVARKAIIDRVGGGLERDGSWIRRAQ
jgi:hypothetical protein